jgi:hypothetical protein
MQDLPMSHVAYRCHSVAGPQPFSPCAVRHTKDLAMLKDVESEGVPMIFNVFHMLNIIEHL